jgi:uncharacterized protein YbbC (DUF1343 family)
MRHPLYFSIIFLLFTSVSNPSCAEKATGNRQNPSYGTREPVPAAHRFEEYVKLLKGKRVGMVVNQTSTVGETHLVDTLISQGVNVVKIFSPEHGFRGDADAGEHVGSSVDAKTGISLVSIYGKKLGPDVGDMAGLDILVFDVQDVGARFYTYISTLQYVMESCVSFRKTLLVLDRPNPNGHYVDGPVLDTSLRSFVGMQAVPLVYGMTVAEYAQMLNGERWLAGRSQCLLYLVTCKFYSHQTAYTLPVKPSPNLPNMKAIYLYPSLCLFEGTNISVGRGTEKQFQIYGAPLLPKGGFSFKPTPNSGAKDPQFNNQVCNGVDFSGVDEEVLRGKKEINLSYLLDAYRAFPQKEAFFLKGNFFEKLAGTKLLREQIKAGKSEAEIRSSWKNGLDGFRVIRKKYLLYEE